MFIDNIEMASENQVPENPEIAWSINPTAENPWKTVLFWIIMGFVIWAFHWNIAIDFPLHKSFTYTFLISLFLLVYLSQIYLTTHYILDANGAGFRRWLYRKQMPWSKIRSVQDDRSKLLVSPFPVKSRLEKYRGLHLYYRSNRDEVLKVVEYYKPGLSGLPSGDPDADVDADVDAL